MLIRLSLDVTSSSSAALRFQRDVDLPAVPRVGDWIDVTGGGAAQPVERVVFVPMAEHVDVVLESVAAEADAVVQLRSALEGAGWMRMVHAG